MALEGQLIGVSDLTSHDREQMLQLMTRHYANVSPKSFFVDLAEKQWVLRLVDDAGQLCGFSTQMLIHTQFDGRPLRALFSGDTIVDPEHWGSRALIDAWRRLVIPLIDENEGMHLYWFLICQGYKTYRFLPLFFKEFYPRYAVCTPPSLKRLIDKLAFARYPDTYDSAAGVVRAHEGQYRLREGVADVTDERARDPHVQCFLERNPLHTRGDELCCIAPLSRQNFSPAAVRLLNQRV